VRQPNTVAVETIVGTLILPTMEEEEVDDELQEDLPQDFGQNEHNDPEHMNCFISFASWIKHK
jgi:hypothetical protein